jgi:hypothetical protein
MRIPRSDQSQRMHNDERTTDSEDVGPERARIAHTQRKQMAWL